MTAEPTTTSGAPPEPPPTWRFPRQFWLANLMELCERAAYYGFFIVLTLYLTQVAGFSDRETGFVAGIFYAGLYLLPPFVGAVSDRIGFQRALLLAFGLLGLGYFFLGIFHSKPAVLFFLLLAMIGGSFIKPLITGTVAKTTDKVNRARAYSLFYWVVNIGSFSGKTVVPSIRQGLGLEYVNFFSAGMCVLALLVALFLFRPTEAESERKSLRDVFRSLRSILTNGRLMALTLIVSGFWIIQAQMYATMPKYVIRLRGEDAKPEWLANVNPLAVVLCVVLVTQLMRKRAAVTSMLVGMVVMPFSAAAMALSTTLESYTGSEVDLWLVTLHPLTVMMIAGIALQGLAECFISPRFLEYFSLQAPKGEEGTYLGFSHLHSFFAALAAFFMSGFLLEEYCPDPKTLPEGLSAAERAAYYAQAHHIWYYFIAIGFTAAVALVVFRLVTRRIDARRVPGTAS
ncbi:MAG: MFS transporter [Deltaproteobacteria bacterium]|nr:MFS transporter [Deltaproteobacteria bacterium]